MTSREDWLAKRMTGISASDAPAVLGVSPYLSALALYAIKVGLTQDTDSEAKRRGRQLEPAILSMAEEEILGPRKWKLERVKPYTLVTHASEPWLMATPDAYYVDHEGERGLVEVKSQQWAPRVDVHSAPTPAQVAQCNHSMEVCGLDRCLLVVLIGGMALKHVLMAKNAEFVTAMVYREKAFWDRVEHRNPPDPDDSASATKALASVYPDSDDDVVVLPEEAESTWEELESLRRMSRDLERNRREASNAIRGWMGSHRYGAMPGSGRILESLRYQQKLQARTVTRIRETKLSSLQSSLTNG